MAKSKGLKYFVLSALLVASLSCFSQVKRIGYPLVKYYSPSEYKAGAQIWKIDIGASGLIYFANTDGVLEFDGFDGEVVDYQVINPLTSIKIETNIIKISPYSSTPTPSIPGSCSSALAVNRMMR